NSIFRTLLVHKVVAMDLRGSLQLPVDPTVTLLHAAGIPRDVKVNEVGAMVLEIHAFPCRVRGNQDAQGMLVGIRVEGDLHFLAAGLIHSAMKGDNTLLRPLGRGDGGAKLLFEVALRISVFSEDYYAPIVPLRPDGYS